MKNKYLFRTLALVVIFQICVLFGEYIAAVYPQWTGHEISLKTVPVDPRSLFRGNYAYLRYAISAVPREDFIGPALPRQNEIVYVKLRQTSAGYYEYAGISAMKPQDGIFIRGRVYYPHGKNLLQKIEIRYGIEALFRPVEIAEKLEKELHDGGLARVKIAANGKAVLLDVVPTKLE